MSAEIPATGKSRRRWSTIAFVVLMLALTAFFAGLGVWQVERLQEKEALIADVEDRFHRPPVDLPASADWASLDTAFYDYRPVTLTGRYVPDQTILVFTSLGEAKGRYSGPGYWVVTPFAIAETGGTVLVNRGFVPQESAEAFGQGGGATPAGTVTITGIARASEPVGTFDPAPDTAKHIDWVRNTERLATEIDASLAPVAGVYVDLPAGDAGALPQGGETLVEFPNNHLGYAMTWFGFALITPILLVFWLMRQRRKS